MVYGKDVRSANVSTDYPGVRIDSLVRLDSPNYLLIYMNVKDAKAGVMNLKFQTAKGKAQTVKYSLNERMQNVKTTRASLMPTCSIAHARPFRKQR